MDGDDVKSETTKDNNVLVGVPNFSNDELKKMCNEMLFQIRGNYIEEHEQCEEQGNSDWQIAMYYFRKLNGSKK